MEFLPNGKMVMKGPAGQVHFDYRVLNEQTVEWVRRDRGLPPIQARIERRSPNEILVTGAGRPDMPLKKVE